MAIILQPMRVLVTWGLYRLRARRAQDPNFRLKMQNAPSAQTTEQCWIFWVPTMSQRLFYGHHCTPNAVPRGLGVISFDRLKLDTNAPTFLIIAADYFAKRPPTKVTSCGSL